MEPIDLQQEVARALCLAMGDDPEREGPFSGWFYLSPYALQADAAIAIVERDAFERAAKVAETFEHPVESHLERWDNGRFRSGLKTQLAPSGDDIASAIRALAATGEE